jgi:hypothetical protein
MNKACAPFYFSKCYKAPGHKLRFLRRYDYAICDREGYKISFAIPSAQFRHTHRD